MFLLVGCSLLMARYAYHAVFGQQQTPHWISIARSGIAILIVGILALDGLNMLFGRLDRSERPFASVVLIILAVAISYFHLRFGALRLPSRKLLRTPLLWILLATTVGSTYWSLLRLNEVTSLTSDVFSLEAFMDGDLHQLPGLIALTDRDREIPLFRYTTSNSPAKVAALSESLKTETGSTAIFRAPPDPQANCHGWVFTGGRFLIKGDDVQQILDDNGYLRIADPESGDLVVYRDTEGWITHTGIVRGILDDATIIVESKWGVEGTYLHAPEAQPFSQVFDFYRSPRNGHLLVVRDRDAGASAGRSKRNEASSFRSFHGQKQLRPATLADPEGSQG
jgi:hypothetical protein